MTRYMVRCPGCERESPVSTDGVRLLTAADPAMASRVVFMCPRCSRQTSAEVDRDVAEALIEAGVDVSHGHPSLGRRAERHAGGPPLDHDDLLDLHLLLQRSDWFDELLAASVRAASDR